MGILSSVVNDIGGTIANIGSLFGFGGTHPYPGAVAERVTNVKVDQTDQSWRKSLGYGFKVVRVTDTDQMIPASGWQDFILQINPQELTQDEIFAIEVTPTFSGVLVEHQGVTLKDIMISGTTGLSPMRRAGGALPQSGAPAFGAGRSGYYEFQELRSYFRTYVEQKRSDPESDLGQLRMVWQNFRDHEDLFVEPQKFTMKRTAAKPHLYDYVITLKAIGIADVTSEGDWLSAIDDFVEDAQDALDAASKVLEGGIGFLERVERDVRNTILDPIRSVGNFTRIWNQSGQRLEVAKKRYQVLEDVLQIQKFVVNRKAIADLYEKTVEVQDNANDYLNRDTEAYNSSKDRIATLRTGLIMTNNEYSVLNGLRKVMRGLDKTTQSNKLFQPKATELELSVEDYYNEAKAVEQKQASSETLKAKETEYNAAVVQGDIVGAAAIQEEIVELQNDATNKLSAANQKISMIKANSSREVSIEIGDNIQIVAARYLKNPDRFKEIVILNNLSPPYIDPTAIEDDPIKLPGVLRPGDKILIPQTIALTKPSGTVMKVDEYPISKSLNAIEKNFGIDFKLTDDFDIAVSSTQEIDLIGGSKNVAQAIVTKILLDTGALKRHPEIGTNLSIGTRVTNPRATVDQIRTTLLADSRIESVIYVNVKQEGNTTEINLILRLKGIDHPVDVPVNLAA